MSETLKIALKHHCLRLLEKQASDMQEALDEIHLALEEETKSSVGDKYETSRAQLQIEQKRMDQQMAHIVSQHKALKELNHDPHRVIDEGSLVTLTLADKAINLYIGVALGAVVFNDVPWQIISELSPLAQALKGKKAGESFSFQGKTCTVQAVN